MTLYRTRLDAALAGVRHAPFLLDAVAAADELAAAAAADSRPRAVALLASAALDAEDSVTAIAAVHAAAAVTDDDADALLSDLLSHERTHLREHAAEALALRLPHLHAIGRLVAAVAAGDFSGMLAQRTLGLWAPSAPEHIALALEGGLASGHDRSRRARLVETLGLVPGDLAARALLRIATDVGEQYPARATAVAALGDRAWVGESRGQIGSSARTSRAISSVLRDLSTDGDLAATARLAALDLELAARPGGRPGAAAAADRPAGEGLRVAQLFLHADLDRGLTRAGAGDTGGVATLLVRLGDALASREGIEEVLTLSRGSADDALDALTAAAVSAEQERHRLVPVPLGVQPDAEPPAMATAWPTRVAALRGIRRVLRALGPIDALHLRMADVGSMVAAGVAADLGIATVFTLAPDPHAVIAALEATGALSRASFGEADSREHFWFRLRLVAQLADGASHRVLFPRPRLVQELTALLGTDVDLDVSPRGGASVVPEGIDLSVTQEAAEQHALTCARREGAPIGGGSLPTLDPDALESLIAALPARRHGLPVLLSVGRLHRVKGMATVVEAWAADPDLQSRANLVIAGGDLEAPSADEREQLTHIAGVLAAAGLDADDGLVMAGHRPHHQVAAWMATTAAGDAATGGALVGAGGAYLCGSLKEEFGLALLEALAAGLVVVAPAGGGPATYVEDGASGLLVDTRDPADVRRGARAALDLAVAPGRPAVRARAQAMVAGRFTVGAMAGALADVYSRVAQHAPAQAPA